ncbi:RNA-directed DNA polymerase, eukaryota [Tanacetum coccineum]
MTILTNEGFVDITIYYMGELWVLLEFTLVNSKKLFHANVGVSSWFSKLIQASTDFNTKGRIIWVEIEGIPFKLWSGNKFKRIASKWRELLDTDDQDDKCFHSKRLCIHTRLEVPGWVPDFLEEYDDEDQSDDGSKDGDPKAHDLGSCGGDSDVAEVPDTLFEEKGQNNDKLDEVSTGQKVNHSEDPFGIYPLLNTKKDMTETNNNSEHSLKYPPGFTPNEDSDAFCMNVEDDRNNDYVAESVCSGHFKKSEAPCSSRSILNLMEELVKVGQTMGYNMDGCMNNMTEIIESQGATEVNFLELQETKMENMEIFSVKMCRGNFAFDYVHGDSVGNSGGIMCVWDPNSFRKISVTVSDYFILIRGVWLKTENDLLIVAVYAPHDLKDKRMLWDYLVHEITKWHGEVVIIVTTQEFSFNKIVVSV